VHRAHTRLSITRPSTVTEHTGVAVGAEVGATAPGRIEGSCEHTDLAIARRPDGGHGAHLRGSCAGFAQLEPTSLCEALGVGWDASREDVVASFSVEDLERLVVRLGRERRWPDDA
jgi:hypothetical protein